MSFRYKTVLGPMLVIYGPELDREFIMLRRLPLPTLMIGQKPENTGFD